MFLQVPAKLLPAKSPNVTTAQSRQLTRRGHNCDEECGLKLDDQMRLAYESQGHLQSPRSLALQLQIDTFLAGVGKSRPWIPAIHEACKTALKKCHAFHRLFRPNLCRTPGEAFVIRLLLERPVHARRTDLQHIARSGYQFLNVEDHAQLLADPLAIRMRNLGVRVGRLAIFGSRRNPVDVHPQEALLADFPFDVNDFQTFRSGDPLGSFANFFQLQAETPRPRPV